MSSTALPHNDHPLVPPKPIFADAGYDPDTDALPPNTHSRTQSRTSGSIASMGSLPARSLGFSAITSANPFSPPPSVRSFSSPQDHIAPTAYFQRHPIPDMTPRSFRGSAANSIVDVPNICSSTADSNSLRQSARLREAFASPPVRPLTVISTAPPSAKPKRERAKSTMSAGDIPPSKPWLKARDPSARAAYWLTYGIMLLGVIGGAIRCFFGWTSVSVMKSNLCIVLDEDFERGEQGVFGENGKFFREVEMSGFGNGEFEMTTKSSNNSFVYNGRLYITPTLTAETIGADKILDGHIYNSTDCTYNSTHGLSYTDSTTTSPSKNSTDIAFDSDAYYKACSAVSNATAGHVINPIQSARLSTRWSASIKYGRVEVKAKLPTGDWMWPAIWMLPVANTYGEWPMSGEIDIMEARGNGPSYPNQGVNYVRSSLNWGPTSWIRAAFKTYGWWTTKWNRYDTDFHTYVLEWTEDFIRMYVDKRLHHMLDLRLDVPFFQRGDFPPVVQNGSESIVLKNPWANGTTAAPFDQPFYLILNVAVGGINGWFPDGDEKPWLDGSLTAMRDFVKTQDQWYPTWPASVEDRSMVIDHVKMWQQC